MTEHPAQSALPTAKGAEARPRRRLAGSRRKAVLTVHIAAALGLLGASTVLLIGGLHAATREDPEEAHAVYTLLRLLTFSVDIPLAVVTLLAGLTLALTSTWRIFGDRWLTAKLVLYLATATLGAAFLGPSIDTMLDVTETSKPADSSTRWLPIVLTTVQATMLVAAATLGVFKPGRRVRRSLVPPQALKDPTGEMSWPTG
jgi:uncharacterized membrane protein